MTPELSAAIARISDFADRRIGMIDLDDLRTLLSALEEAQAVRATGDEYRRGVEDMLVRSKERITKFPLVSKNVPASLDEVASRLKLSGATDGR